MPDERADALVVDVLYQDGQTLEECDEVGDVVLHAADEYDATLEQLQDLGLRHAQLSAYEHKIETGVFSPG